MGKRTSVSRGLYGVRCEPMAVEERTRSKQLLWARVILAQRTPRIAFVLTERAAPSVTGCAHVRRVYSARTPWKDALAHLAARALAHHRQ